MTGCTFRMLRAGVFGWIVSAGFLLQGQLQDITWSQPHRLSSPDGVAHDTTLLVDGRGRTHAFWVEDRLFESRILLMYARFDGFTWSDPLVVREEAPAFAGQLVQASAAIEAETVLHVLWGGNGGPLYLSSTLLEGSLQSASWSPPMRVEVDAFKKRLFVDRSGAFHLFYSKHYGVRPNGLFYQKSADRGLTWSPPVRLDGDPGQQYILGHFDVDTDENDRFHVTWSYVDTASPSYAVTVLQYCHSFDNGKTWSPPFSLDQATVAEPELVRMASPVLSVFGQEVLVTWAGGGQINVGRRWRRSSDSGVSWGPVGSFMGDLHGAGGADAVVRSANGRTDVFAQVRWPQAIYRISWEAGKWSEPSMVYLIARDYTEPRGERLHGQFLNATMSPQGQQVVTMETCGAGCGDTPANSILYAIHTYKPVAIAPLLDFGPESSVRLTVLNPTDSQVRAIVSMSDTGGAGATTGGVSTEVMSLLLPSRGSETVVLRDISRLPRASYASVEYDQLVPAAVVALVQFSSGDEIVLPFMKPGRRFGLFVERSQDRQIHIAALHFATDPIDLELYDLNGVLVSKRVWVLQAERENHPLHHLVDMPREFNGYLILSSASSFVPIGMRVDTLGTSPAYATDLDSLPERGPDYFPHYADGWGWSVRTVSTNISEETANATLGFFDSSGVSQQLPSLAGTVATVSLPLPGHATRIVSTDGSSTPMKTGYARIDADRKVHANFVLKSAAGLETEIPSLVPGRKFALLVERRSTPPLYWVDGQVYSIEIGVAYARLSTKPIGFRIYDSRGLEIGSGVLPGEGYHAAALLRDLITLPDFFQGLLVFESEGDFVPFGVRLGSTLLSAVPVVRLK